MGDRYKCEHLTAEELRWLEVRSNMNLAEMNWQLLRNIRDTGKPGVKNGHRQVKPLKRAGFVKYSCWTDSYVLTDKARAYMYLDISDILHGAAEAEA